MLHAGERPSLGEPLAAVVAGEDNNGSVCETSRVERLEHSADIHVEALHHGAVGLLGTAVTVKYVLDTLGLGFVVWPLPRPMRRGKMQAHQEGLLRLRVAFHGLHCPIAEQVRHVSVSLDRHLLLMKLI